MTSNGRGVKKFRAVPKGSQSRTAPAAMNFALASYFAFPQSLKGGRTLGLGLRSHGSTSPAGFIYGAGSHTPEKSRAPAPAAGCPAFVFGGWELVLVCALDSNAITKMPARPKAPAASRFRIRVPPSPSVGSSPNACHMLQGAEPSQATAPIITLHYLAGVSLRGLFAQDSAGQLRPAREHDLTNHSDRVSLFTGNDGDRDVVACVQGVAVPAGPLDDRRRIGFDRPAHNFPLIVFYVEKNLAVRVGPVEIRYGAFQSHRVLHVVIRSAMVRVSGSARDTSGRQQEADSDAEFHETPPPTNTLLDCTYAPECAGVKKKALSRPLAPANQRGEPGSSPLVAFWLRVAAIQSPRSRAAPQARCETNTYFFPTRVFIQARWSHPPFRGFLATLPTI